MRINHSKNKKTAIIIISIVVLLLLAGTAYAVSTGLFNRSSSGPVTNLDPATEEQKKEGENTKSSTVDSEDTSSESTKNPDSPTQPSTPSNITVQTSASAQNGNIYQLRYLIESVVSNATCTLTLKSGSEIITKTSKTQALAQSSTCQGFDISTTELHSGTWEASLVVSGESISGSTNSTIKVQ